MRALGINFDRSNTFLTPSKVLMTGSYAMKETEEGLEIRDFSAINGMQVDKYGNILTATGDIFLLSDQQLRRPSSFTDENVTASYDEFYKIIFAWNEQGENYVLDADNKFVKTKAAGFYNYLKSFNDQRVNINNIGTYWSAAISWAERNNYNDDLANSTEEERKDIISSWYKEMYGYSIFAFTEDGYVAVGCGATRPFAYYESGSKAYTPEGPIDKIYEYGYVRNDSATKDTVFSGGFGNSVIRGTAAYKLNDCEIYKYSFLDGSVTKLDVGIYRVTEVTISQDRRIEITGLYENLDTVKGYLDLNDQISFGEPNSKGITVLTPIN